MASQSWVSLLNAASPQASGPGTALNTLATATISPVTGAAATSDVALVNAAGQPLGWSGGLLIRVTAMGYLTTTSTSTTATIFLAANRGNAGTYTTLCTPVGITTGTTPLTGIQWSFEAIARCATIATSGTVNAMGRLTLGNAGAALPANPIALTASPPPGMTLFAPNASGETAATVDTTQLTGICMRGTLAAANATIQLSSWAVEALD